MNDEKKYHGYGYHGGGRKPSEKPKNRNLNIRLTEEALNAIKEKASASGKSVTEFILFSCGVSD